MLASDREYRHRHHGSRNYYEDGGDGRILRITHGATYYDSDSDSNSDTQVPLESRHTSYYDGDSDGDAHIPRGPRHVAYYNGDARAPRGSRHAAYYDGDGDSRVPRTSRYT